MAKKQKRRRPKEIHRLLTIRVAVPVKMAEKMRVWQVIGKNGPGGGLYCLEILNSKYGL